MGNQMRAENLENKEDRGDIGEGKGRRGVEWSEGVENDRNKMAGQNGGRERKRSEVGTTGRWSTRCRENCTCPLTGSKSQSHQSLFNIVRSGGEELHDPDRHGNEV